MNRPAKPRRLPELDRSQVIHTARCLLRGENPPPGEAEYFSAWVDEGHFDGREPRFSIERLTGSLHPKIERKVPNSPHLQKELIEEAIREVLQAVRDTGQTFSGSLVVRLLSAYRKELNCLMEAWDKAEADEKRSRSVEFEPQAVTAARAILEHREPPREVFLDSVHHRICWYDERRSIEDCFAERSNQWYLPRTGDSEHEHWLRSAIEDPANRNLRLNAICEALREAFELYKLNNTRGTDFESRNMNMFFRFQKAILDEMEALVNDWDTVAGGGARCS